MLCWVTPDRSLENKPGEPLWAPDIGISLLDWHGAAQRRSGSGSTGLAPSRLCRADREQPEEPDCRCLGWQHHQHCHDPERHFAAGDYHHGNPGYTDAELRYLISTLDAGSLPVAISNEPVSEEMVGPEQDRAGCRRSSPASLPQPCSNETGTQLLCMQSRHKLRPCYATFDAQPPPLPPFGVILPANHLAAILPSRTTNVSVASSYRLSAVSAVHRM